MSKDIKKFLPSTFRSEEIYNFLDTTTQTLFDKKKSEAINYYIGRKTGGVYSPLVDPYAEERTQSRDAYQLEPSLVQRNAISGDIENILFYEDLLNNLKSSGSLTDDQSRLFSEEILSYAPPIDYDMFVNFRDYYWIPEGAPAIEINALPNDIIGELNYVGSVVGVNESLRLTSGNHIILNDGKEYIVDGVGSSIRLIEFDLDNNIPLRIERAFFSDNLSLTEKFPKEYITMERDSSDFNPWSRNNAWYHIDALYPNVSTRPDFTIDRTRRATRPIIQFMRDIELYNYPTGDITAIDVFYDGVTLPTDTIDDVDVVAGMKAITSDNDSVYEFDGSAWNIVLISTDKVAILDGRMNKSKEFIKDSGSWVELQQKTANTQSILFNLYDVNETPVDHVDFEGTSLFTYETDSLSLIDSELGIRVALQASGDGSDFVFANSIRDTINDLNIGELYYKILSNESNDSKVVKFTIDDHKGSPSIFANGEPLGNVVLRENVTYLFDYSDSSTSISGWYDNYFPIEVVDDSGTEMVRSTHADSSVSVRAVSFSLDGNPTKELFYHLTDNHDVVGTITVVPNITNDQYEYRNEFIFKGIERGTLKQSMTVINDGNISINIKFKPISDNNIIVKLNGEVISSYAFENRNVLIESLSEGDYVEVEYQTIQRIKPHKEVTQLPFASMSNNSGNKNPILFSFGEVFNHFGSIIRSQLYLTGSEFGTNNYRDTLKDITLGTDILKHTAPMIPLSFVNDNENIDVIESINLSRGFYTQFKNNLILRAEEIIRTEVVDETNARDVLDQIVLSMSAGKQSTDSFASSLMFAAYQTYNTSTVDANGYIQQEITLGEGNVLYVYSDTRLLIEGFDYTLIFDEVEGLYQVTDIDPNEIRDVRYYASTQATFCPSTPAKFGIFNAHRPRLMIDSTFTTPVVILLGHDGSRTVAYTTVSSFNNDVIDPRDLLVLEFESRIYNSIDPAFKNGEVPLLEYRHLIPGKYRNTDYSRDEFNNIEYEKFFRWSSLNQVNHTENNTYQPGNPFTYNYSHNVDMDGEPLPGHWKGIYLHFYDTTTPHKTPWEMLGFDIEPDWWVDVYGTNYSSHNSQMWGDIEKGIIRDGARKNVDNFEYLTNNPYSRPGLSDIIPVDNTGKLRDPISTGITTEPLTHHAKAQWSYGDYAPAEQAWKSMSDFWFFRLITLYNMKPAMVVSKIWDTVSTSSNTNHYTPEFDTLLIHSQDNNVPGLTKWIVDFLLSENFNLNDELYDPKDNVEYNLAYKVGGFINSKEMNLYTEGYNPTSNTTSTLVPSEDLQVITHQSKDINSFTYSGVIVERVAVSRDFFNFTPGAIYRKDDIIYISEDRAYYRKKETISYDIWESAVTYQVGDEVVYNNTVYVAINANTDSNPESSTDWEIKDFIDKEWAIMITPPSTKHTEFKVYGYDIRNPFFKIAKEKMGGKRRSVNVLTSRSKPINPKSWEPNTRYGVGDFVTLDGNIFEATRAHISASSLDTTLWYKHPKTPMTNTFRVDYPDETINEYDMVEYGTRFRDIQSVVRFLSLYGKALEDDGWKFTDFDRNVSAMKDWHYSIKDFVRWAVDNKDKGAVVTLSPFSTKVNFKPVHGVASILSQYKYSAFNLLDYTSGPISLDSVDIKRNNGKFILESEFPVYFVRIGVREYEHALVLNNTTVFNDVNYDPVLGIRKDRFRISAVKSSEWDGRLYAPGYIIDGNELKPNLDTAVSEIQTISDMDTISSKNIINELKYHNLGYQKREYLENLEMSDKSQINFYQGFIRQKGTSEAFQRLLRSNVIDANDTLDISEEWSFRQGVFGGSYNELQTEFFITADQFNNNPQRVRLVYNNKEEIQGTMYTNIDIDDGESWIKHPNRFQPSGDLWKVSAPDYKFPTAGYAQWQEHELKSATMKKLTSSMKASEIAPEASLTAWIGKNEVDHGSWGIYVLEDTEAFASEIFNHGNEGSNSAVIKPFNIDDSLNYIVRVRDEFYNVSMRFIKDGYYLLLEHSGDYVVFENDVEPSELTFMVWKPLRIMDDLLSESISTIDDHINEFDITPFEGMYIYKDSKHYGDNQWAVYQYQSDEWVLIREKGSKSVDPRLFNEIIAYDEDNEIIDYINVFDPLQGYIPGSLINEVEFVSPEDPVTYTNKDKSFSNYSTLVGMLWLDTSEMVFIDYHQGDLDYRIMHWGSLFPGAEVPVYEWVRSGVAPEDYEGEVKDADQFIKSEEWLENLGMYKTMYYFWAKNRVDVDDNTNRTFNALEISQSIRYPYNNGIPYVSLYDNNTFSITDSTRRLIMNDVIIRFNYKYQPSDTQTHTQWVLVEENPKNNEISSFIIDKMFDSILGNDVNGDPVPDPSLPGTSSIGTNPDQTWFINTERAREIFYTKLNDYLTKVNIWDVDLHWNSDSSVEFGNEVTLNDWYTDDFDHTVVITSIITDRNDLPLIRVVDGEYIQVNESPSNKPSTENGGWTIFEYNTDNKTFRKVGQSGSVIAFDVDYIVAGEVTDTTNLRNMLQHVFTTFAIEPYESIINDVVFSMVRYVMVEQPSNNWVFPSTYISVRQELENLVTSAMFRRDKEEEIRQYIEEAKPYHTKLRSYNKIMSPAMDIVGMRVTDFDKPPYIDDNWNKFDLQERFIDAVQVDGVSVTYELENVHLNDVIVSVGGQFVNPDNYEINGRFITFDTPPQPSSNMVYALVVESTNTVHRDIINEWDVTYGYRTLQAKRDLEVWAELAINKDVDVHFDRVSHRPVQYLERLVEILDHANTLEKPYEYLDSLSDSDIIDEFLSELDRVAIHMFENDLRSIVTDSATKEVQDREDYFFETGKVFDENDLVVTINQNVIHHSLYTVEQDTSPEQSTIRFMFEPMPGNIIVVRPKSSYFKFLFDIGNFSGLNVNPGVTYINDGFDGISVIVDTDVNNPIEVDIIEDDIEVEQTDEFLQGDDTDIQYEFGDFDSNNAYPEELTGLNIKETMIFTSLNQLPPLVKMGFNTFGEKGIQETVSHTIQTGVTEYAVTVTVPFEQVKVIVEDDVLGYGVHYEVESDKIILLKEFDDGLSLTITDRYSNFDPNYHDGVSRITNVNGGFDSYVFDYSSVDDSPLVREFIVYAKDGKVHYLKAPANDFVTVDKTSIDSDTISFIDDVQDRHNRYFVLFGFDGSLDNEENIKYEIVRGSIVGGELINMTRGLFIGENEDFSDVSTVYLYELQVEEKLESFVIQEKIFGITGKTSYPKYGHIIH